MAEDFFDDIDEYSDEDELRDVQDGEEMFEHYRFVADKGQGAIRVDKYLAMHIVGVSRNRIQQAADANCILVNDKPVKSNYKIKPGDVISVVMDRPRRDLEIIPEDIPLDIVYEDEDLMVINKPPGLVVHPGFGNYQGTMVNAVAYRLKDTPEYDAKDPRLGIVHRIDKDTSGLTVVIKNAYTKTHLSAQFFNKTTKRQNLALLWGQIAEN